MGWKPLHPKHAIERVRVVARFQEALPSRFLRKLAADYEGSRLELGFTSKNIRHGSQIALTASRIDVAAPDAMIGWDWQRLSPANSPMETLFLEGQVLVHEMVEYDRWQHYKDRLEVVGLPVLGDILDVIDLASLTLEYIDRFVFHGEFTEARPDLLLKNVAETLHQDAASGFEPWHFHRGWFETTDGLRLLINQNIDAQDGRMDNGSLARSVQVLTKTDFRPDKGEFDFASIKSHLDIMHKRSIDLFKGILQPGLLPEVGIGGE